MRHESNNIYCNYKRKMKKSFQKCILTNFVKNIWKYNEYILTLYLRNSLICLSLIKKLTLGFALSLCAAGAAGQAYMRPSLSDNWRAGISLGASSPVKGHSFAGNIRPTIGFEIEKRVTPALSLGSEAFFGFNTSRWPGHIHSNTAFDSSYLGAYGSIDFMHLTGDPCAHRLFTTGLRAGAGWGHDFMSGPAPGHSFFATKAGIYFDFNITPRFTISLSPSMLWNMSDSPATASSASYNAHRATFNLQAGMRYCFGRQFECAALYDGQQIDALNGRINTLRAGLDKSTAKIKEVEESLARLAAQLEECRNSKPEIVREVTVDNRLNTVLDVFFMLGSSTVTADQMPNVERIALFMKNHPRSTVVIKGYASRDGNRNLNENLAARRAEAVKNLLIKRYHIAPSRIKAMGAGIGDLFEEDSWNRVSVCTIHND